MILIPMLQTAVPKNNHHDSNNNNSKDYYQHNENENADSDDEAGGAVVVWMIQNNPLRPSCTGAWRLTRGDEASASGLLGVDIPSHDCLPLRSGCGQ